MRECARSGAAETREVIGVNLSFRGTMNGLDDSFIPTREKFPGQTPGTTSKNALGSARTSTAWKSFFQCAHTRGRVTIHLRIN